MAVCPASVTTWMPSPYGTLAPRAAVVTASPIIACCIASDSTRPLASACIQRAVSRAVPPSDPAPPAAVMTERNGITLVARATATGRTPPLLRRSSRYPIVRLARGFSTAWYHVSSRSSGSSSRSRTSRASDRPVTASTSSPSSM